MKRALRLSAFFLAVLLILPLLSACSSKKQEQTVIGTCDGFEVLYEELRYVTLTYKDILEAKYGEGIWDDPTTAEAHRAELEERVWDVMLNNYAVLSTCLDYGMLRESMFSDTINDAVDEKVKTMIEENFTGKSEFRRELKALHMTENFYRFTIRVALLENELKYILTDDLGVIETDPDSFLDWMTNGNSVYVQHIFIRNDKDDDIEANRAAAEEVRQEILSGDAELSDYVGTKLNEDLETLSPYFVVREVYVEELETAIFALKEIGDVSEVVETEDGFYLFQRLDYTEDTLLLKVEELLESYQWAVAEKICMAKKEYLSIELNDYGKSLDLLKIK